MKGFTLLIAVVLASIAVSVTLALTTFAYKGLILSSAAKDSQHAFYAADAALECVLYYDSAKAPAPRKNPFPLSGSPSAATVLCGGQTIQVERTTPASGTTVYRSNASQSGWFSMGDRCARFTVYKTATQVRAYAEGSNLSCSQVTTNPRAIVRAIRAIY